MQERQPSCTHRQVATSSGSVLLALWTLFIMICRIAVTDIRLSRGTVAHARFLVDTSHGYRFTGSLHRFFTGPLSGVSQISQNYFSKEQIITTNYTKTHRYFNGWSFIGQAQLCLCNIYVSKLGMFNWRWLQKGPEYFWDMRLCCLSSRQAQVVMELNTTIWNYW